jgi:tRNA G18 (ribose-2'-O)-methylase SpoU
MLTHVRHKPPTPLDRPRELIVACPPMHSRVNLSRIVRAASCCGVMRVITGGSGKLDREITRDAADHVTLEVHRTLPPVLARLKQDGYVIVGLEQTDNSVNLHTFAFPRRCTLVLGHERHGIEDDVLRLLDHAVERVLDQERAPRIMARQA